MSRRLPERAARRPAGQLEAAVLAALWADGGSLTATQVQARLAEAGDELAQTSVTTTLSRLHAKGLLERHESGRAHSYQPTAGAADAAAEKMRSLLGAGSARAQVLSRFVEGLEPADEQILQQLLIAATDPGEPRRRPRVGRRP